MNTLTVDFEGIPHPDFGKLALEATGDGTLTISIQTKSGDYRFLVPAQDMESLLKGSYISKSDLQRTVLELSIKIQKGEIP